MTTDLLLPTLPAQSAQSALPARPALRSNRRRSDTGDIEIRAMSQPRDLGHAWVLLARQRRWLISIGVDVAQTAGRDSDDYRDPAGYYAAPEGVLLIASRRGRPIGMAGIRLARERTLRAELRRLYVDVHERGNGLGRMLLTTAIERARVLHADEVVVQDLLGPKSAAVSLYRSIGFEDGPNFESSGRPGVLNLRLPLFATARV